MKLTSLLLSCAVLTPGAVLTQTAHATTTAVATAAQKTTPKPNILLILADDMGFMDISCNGSDLYRTPNIDRLAAGGTRFTRAYTAAHVCSPTRASLLTGKYPARLHLTDWLTGHNKPFAKLQIPDWTKRLPQTETNIAGALKQQGYATAWLGKWHLGGGAQDYGFNAGQQVWALNTKQDSKDPKGVFTLNSEAKEFIETNRGKPFFVALSHYSPHGPVRYEETLKNDYQKIIEEKKTRQTNVGYAAMIEALDSSVGQMLDYLEEKKLAENTLVIFYSDNGGELNYTTNAPLRHGKGSLYEGGVRVPLIARWPGHVPAGKTSDALISSIDFLPTFAALSGAPLTAKVDGLNIAPVLTGDAKMERDTLYWHYPHYHSAKPAASVLKGDWKLIQWFETGETELFNLADDPYEKENLAARQPEKNAALLADLKAWQASVGAQMMTPNPNYDPQNADRTQKKAQKNKAGKKEKPVKDKTRKKEKPAKTAAPKE